MPRNKKIVESLNQLIKGEHMSIDAFNIYISKLKDQNVMYKFQEIQDQHRENIKQLSHYIHGLDGQAEENTGLSGRMAKIKMNMQTSSDIPASDYIKKAIEGMTKGIAMTEELLRGDLDASSRELVGQILERDRESIEKLNDLIQ